MTGISHLS